MNILPAKHRHAAREQAFIQGLSNTWNSIAPDLDTVSDRDAAEALCDCYVEMYGNMAKEDLDAWHDLLRSPVKKDYTLARRLARSVL